MTHIEITKQFTALSLKEGDLVKIQLVNDEEIIGSLSSGKVFAELNDNEGYINSRIGLLPPPPPPGMIYPMMVKTIYSDNITSIEKI